MLSDGSCRKMIRYLSDLWIIDVDQASLQLSVKENKPNKQSCNNKIDLRNGHVPLPRIQPADFRDNQLVNSIRNVLAFSGLVHHTTSCYHFAKKNTKESEQKKKPKRQRRWHFHMSRPIAHNMYPCAVLYMHSEISKRCRTVTEEQSKPL